MPGHAGGPAPAQGVAEPGADAIVFRFPRHFAPQVVDVETIRGDASLKFGRHKIRGDRGVGANPGEAVRTIATSTAVANPTAASVTADSTRVVESKAFMEPSLPRPPTRLARAGSL